MRVRLDAHAILGRGCGGLVGELRRADLDLVMVEVEEGGEQCLRELKKGALRGGPRVLAYGGGAACPGVCPRLGRLGEGAEFVLIKLGEDGVGEVAGELRRRPNKVRALIVDFSEARGLWESGGLDLAKLADIARLGLDYHAPLIVGSGARRAEEVLGARVLRSLVNSAVPGYDSRLDYRRLLEYLYEQAAVMRLGGP